MLGIEPRTSRMRSERSTPELHPLDMKLILVLYKYGSQEICNKYRIRLQAGYEINKLFKIVSFNSTQFVEVRF